jgi:thioredoxin-like negative regulator of GroEL/HEAT repeat protein
MIVRTMRTSITLGLFWIVSLSVLHSVALTAPQLPRLDNIFGDPPEPSPTPNQQQRADGAQAEVTDLPQTGPQQPPAPEKSQSEKSQSEKAQSKKPQSTQPKSGKVIELQTEIEKAEQLAMLEGRPMLVLVGADWCTWCRKLELEIQEAEAEPILKSWVVVKVDADEQPEFAESMQAAGLPALRVLDFHRNIVAKHEGYMPADELLKWLNENYAAANPAVQAVLFGTAQPNESELRQLIDLLADRSPKIRVAAQQRLIPIRSISAKSIVDILKAGKLAQQLSAIHVLSVWKAPIDAIDPWTPDTLSEERYLRLSEWLQSIPQEAAEKSTDQDTTGEASSEAANDALTDIIRNPSEGTLAHALSFGNTIEPLVRARLASDVEFADSQRIVLRELLYVLLASNRTRLDHSTLLRSLSSHQVDNHRKAAEALLVKLTKEDERLLDELSRDTDPLVRELTVPVLDKRGLLKQKERLLNLLSDKSPSVRTAVLRAFTSDSDAETAGLLVDYVGNETDEDLLVFAAKTLGSMKLKTTREALAKLLNSESWRVRAAAIDSLSDSLRSSSSSTSLSEDLVDGVIKAINDKDSFVVSRATAILPKVLNSKNKEKIVGILVKNPNLISQLIGKDRTDPFSDGDETKELVKAALKFVSPEDDIQTAGAILLVARIAPLELRSTVSRLLEQDALKKDGQLPITLLESYIRLMAALRQEYVALHRYNYSEEKVSAPSPWYEVPKSFKKLPDGKDSAAKEPRSESPSPSKPEEKKPKSDSNQQIDTAEDLDNFFGSKKPSEKADISSPVAEQKLPDANKARDEEKKVADDRIGLPSTWMKLNGQPSLQAADFDSATAKWRESVRQKFTAFDLQDPATNKPDKQNWIRAATLASGDIGHSAVVLKTLDLSQVDAQEKLSSEQISPELTVSWLSPEHRLELLQSLKIDWSNPTPKQTTLLNEATIVDEPLIAEWLFIEAEKNTQNTEALFQIRSYLLRALVGVSAVSTKTGHYFTSYSSRSTNQIAGRKPAIQWLRTKFEGTKESNIRALLFSCLNQIDASLATSSAIGYLAQATSVEQPLTGMALNLAFSDSPNFSVDRAVQWLSHPMPEVKAESLMRLLDCPDQYQERSENQWLLSTYYFSDDNPMPGFMIAKREFPMDELRKISLDSDTKNAWAAQLLMLAQGAEVTIEQCLKEHDDLKSRALIACAINKTKRADAEALSFLEQTGELFKKAQIKDQRTVKIFLNSILKVRGAPFVKIRSDLRKFAQEEGSFGSSPF